MNLTKDFLESIEVYDFIRVEDEIIIFYYEVADDQWGNSFSFQNSETYPNTSENLRVVMEYMIEKNSYHLVCKTCGFAQYDKETVLSYWLENNPSQPPYDIDYKCTCCLDVDLEKRLVVGRNYTMTEEE